MFSRINSNSRANDGGNSGNNCGDGNVEYNNNNFPVHNQMSANFVNPLSANSQQTILQNRICANCRTQVTTLWRRNQQQQLVCNDCGIYFALHHKTRPNGMEKDQIHQQRNGKMGAKSGILSTLKDENGFKNEHPTADGGSGGAESAMMMAKMEISESEFSNEQHQNHRKMSTCTASSFDVIRSSDSFSSMFSAISPSSPINRSPNPFTAHFEAINRLPLNHWLKGKNMEAAAEEDEEDNEEMMDQFEETNGGSGGESIMQGLTTMLANLESIRPKLEQTDAQLKAMTAELKRMILENSAAGGQKRIVEQQKTMPPPPIHPQILFTFQPPKLTTIEKGGGNEFEREILEEETTKLVEKLPQIALKLPSDPAHWLKKYPPPKQNRPMNEMAEDVSCWESVLGWKRILEKIHASGEHVWLAPSSRSIKN